MQISLNGRSKEHKNEEGNATSRLVPIAVAGDYCDVFSESRQDYE